MMDWNDENVAILKTMWTDGAVCSEIAAKLNISLGAVSGKIDRLGLEPRQRSRSAGPGSERKPRPRRMMPFVMRKSIAAHLPPPEPLPEIRISDLDIPIGQRCSIFDLSDHRCRWPVGHPSEPDFFFCGAAKPIADGTPYCGPHSRIAFNHAPQRRIRV